MIEFKLIEYNSDEWKQSVELRERILAKPFGEVFDAAELADEAGHIHVAGIIEDQVIAAAVLIPLGEEMKMQRVAIDEGFRGYGYATQMLDFCTEVALARNCSVMFGYAREDVIEFYSKHGYVIEDDFVHAYGIPHVKMSKVIGR